MVKLKDKIFFWIFITKVEKTALLPAKV